MGSSHWAQWDCLAESGAPAQARSVAERFPNETARFGLNTGFGLALRILYEILSHSSEMPWHRFTPRLHGVIAPVFLRKVFEKEGKKKKALDFCSCSVWRSTVAYNTKKVKKSRSRRQTFLRLVTWPHEWKRSHLELSVPKWAISVSRKWFYHLLCHKQKSKINCLLSCIKCFWPANWKTNFIFSLHCLRHPLTSIFITDKEGKLKWSVTVEEKTFVSEF